MNTYRVPVGSGVIYAMVVGLWAVVLLPTWLRNHERTDEGRQVDRFRRAMTQLSTSHMELLLETPHKQVQAKRALRTGAGAAPAPRVSAAARRRRALMALGAVQMLGLVASARVGMLAVLVPAMLIVTFLTLARGQVRLERARRAETADQAPVTHEGTFARTLASTRQARRTAARTTDVVEQAPAAPTVEAPAAWQPVRTPAPAYVSAPAATAVPRGIDAAGGWTGSAMVEAARAMAEVPAPIEQLPPAPVVAAVEVTAEIPVVRTA